LDYLNVANSLPMWMICSVGVFLALFQTGIFVRKALVAGKMIGLTDTQMKSAMRSSAISSVGPSLVILTGMISLLVTVGGPIAWMRLSNIGSIMFDLMAAGFGAEAMGAKLGAEMSGTAFANVCWAMTLGAVGWLLFTGLFTHKMDNFRNTLAGGRKDLLPIVSVSAMLGAFAQPNAGRIMACDRGTIALLVGAFVMFCLLKYAQKNKVQWIKELALTVAMFVGMCAAISF
jgi:hypothetical protein